MMTVSGAELAKILGCSRARITQLKRSGVLREVGGRRYSLPDSVQAVIRELKQGQASVKLGAARERVLIEQQRRLKILNDRRERSVIDAEEVRSVNALGIVTLTTILEGIPSRTAALLANMTDPAQIRDYLKGEIRTARRALAEKWGALAIDFEKQEGRPRVNHTASARAAE